MPNARNLDGVLVAEVEEHAVVAAAEAEVSAGRPELLHVTGARGQVPIDAIQNLHRDLSLDGAEVGACFRRPDDRDPFRCGVLAH